MNPIITLFNRISNLYLIAIFCSFLPNISNSQVTLANTWTSTLNSHSTTAAAGTNRLLICVIAIEDDDIANDVTAMSYGAIPMHQAVEATTVNGSQQRLEMWYINEAEILAAGPGAHAFTPTFSISDPFAGGHNYYMMSVTVQGAHQTSAFCSAFSNGTTNSTTINLGSSITVATSELLIYTTSGGNDRTHTPSAGFTEGADIMGGPGASSATANHMIGTGGAVNPTATASGTQNRFLICAIRFLPPTATCFSPLPVELINFNVKLQDRSLVDVTWETVTENNNDYFIVERSNDTYNWENITKIDGAGNSNTLLKYKFQDLIPLENISYYRIRQVDFNGSSTVSNIQSVNRNDLDKYFKVYPNPTNRFVYVSAENPINLKIYNIYGKLLNSEINIQQYSSESLILDLESIPNGIYYLKSNNSTEKIQKISN